MKKQYIKPQIETEIIEIPNLMGQSNNMAEAKEQTFEEEDETNPIKDVEFHNIWEDAEDED